MVRDLVDSLQRYGDRSLADLLPGLLGIARRFCGVRWEGHVDDLVMAGCCGALAARSARPGATQAYLHGAARREMLCEARRMMWHGRPTDPRSRRHVPLVDVADAPAEGRAEATACLAQVRGMVHPLDWEAAVDTWGLGMTLREAAAGSHLSAATMHERRSAVAAAARCDTLWAPRATMRAATAEGGVCWRLTRRTAAPAG